MVGGNASKAMKAGKAQKTSQEEFYPKFPDKTLKYDIKQKRLIKGNVELELISPINQHGINNDVFANQTEVYRVRKLSPEVHQAVILSQTLLNKFTRLIAQGVVGTGNKRVYVVAMERTYGTRLSDLPVIVGKVEKEDAERDVLIDGVIEILNIMINSGVIMKDWRPDQIFKGHKFGESEANDQLSVVDPDALAQTRFLNKPEIARRYYIMTKRIYWSRFDRKSRILSFLGKIIEEGWLNSLRHEDYSPAMSAPARRGGIDLTSDKFLQTSNNGEGGIKFHLDPAQLVELQNAPGFYPVIINITPMTDLKGFLGINDSPKQTQLAHV